MSTAASTFVLFSRDETLAASLATALEPLGECYLEQPSPDLLQQIPEDQWPDLAFLDFLSDAENPDGLAAVTGFARDLLRVRPELGCVAVGSMAHSGSAIAALRAGVRDFVDPSRQEELVAVVQRLLEAARSRPARQEFKPAPGPGVMIHGVRPGLGATTLAVHAASLLQERIGITRRESNPGVQPDEDAHDVLARRVLLLDFGTPAADALMYMGLAGSFDVSQAIQELERLDPTMLQAAVSRDRSGLSVLPLGRGLDLAADLDPADMHVLCRRLQSFYGAVVADVGRACQPAHACALAPLFHERWLVIDQSIGALVSLAESLDDFHRCGLSSDGLFLVINRYDPRYGLSARQIEERFDVPVRGVLPERTLALRRSTNMGQLLHRTARRDPYVRAVRRLLDGVGQADEHKGRSAQRRASHRWWRRLAGHRP